MRAKNILALLIGAGILCFTGCASKSVEQLGGGYEEVTYTWTSISEPPAHRDILQYREPSGRRIVVWPLVDGTGVKDGIALFLGEVAEEPRDPDEPRATMRRLFAVRAPEMPMDITDGVLWQWSKKTGIDFSEALKIASIVSVDEKGSQLIIRFAFWNNNDWPRLVTSDWNQISAIMIEVKEKGIVRKDRVLGTSYIDGSFKPEVQK